MGVRSQLAKLLTREKKFTGWFKQVILLLVMSMWLLLLPLPAWAVPPPVERPVLTLELLQERLHTPTNFEGNLTVDLREMVIDLRPNNAEFRDAFYQLLRKELQRAGSRPLGLDLSNSLIQGDLIGSDLGLRTPSYGQALAPIFTPTEQEQLERDRLPRTHVEPRILMTLTSPTEMTVFRGALRLVQTRFNGQVQFNNTFFLQAVEAQGAIFSQQSAWNETRFSRPVNFSGASFRQDARFQGSIFFAKADFNQASFSESAYFQDSTFADTTNFKQASFKQAANFNYVQWQGKTDFSLVRFAEQALFAKATFQQFVLFIETAFEQAVTFREAQFNQSVNLQGARILSQADFSDARFATTANVNVSALNFNSDKAKILGNTGKIGKILTVPTLQGNENVIRNLVQNFRQLQQIPDANQLKYMSQRLRQGKLQLCLLDANNTEVSPTAWLLQAWDWLALSLLLLLSRCGTSVWLVLGVGMVAIAYFGLVFWLVDRFRRLHPQRIIPTTYETVCMIASFSILSLLGLTAIFRTAEQPWLTLGCLVLFIFPIPATLLIRLYQLGRYHDLMDVSYFTEDGTLRQLRLLIGRLPVIPRFPLFRERYPPILWNQRWNWLNYYDFSLNNLLRLGFNDIRLRDEHLPGIITTLAWYQWSLGLLYITLLLWTLSRTIPGVNLLIYLK